MNSIEKVNYKIGEEEITVTRQDVMDIYQGKVALVDKDIDNFLRLCKYQRLNPFLGDVYITKEYGYYARFPVKKEFVLKRANKNPDYRGMQSGITIIRNGIQMDIDGYIRAYQNDVLVGGWAKVYRKDFVCPFYINVPLSLYGGRGGMWNDSPELMIRKVAIVQAMREAFPDDFNQLYEMDEMLFQTKEENHEAGEKAQSQQAQPPVHPVQNQQAKQQPVQQQGQNPVAKNTTAGVAGNPNAIPTIQNKVADLKSALAHVGSSGQYQGQCFGTMLNTDPQALSVFTFYGNMFNNADGEAARAITEAVNSGLLTRQK